MEATQLSLFAHQEEQKPVKRHKKAKLGRYERIQRELEVCDQLSLNPCLRHAARMGYRDSYKIFIEVDSPPAPADNYTFVDLFSGAGGMTQGFFQAGFQPIASVEINEIASLTYRKNFPQCHHFCGDIEKFDSHQWLAEIGSPKVHLVVGGPPCQGFSVAGKRNPDDPRNRLFHEFVRVVSEIRPWYVVMENVPGILTIKNGTVRQEICEAFANIGYPHISVAILESAAYGVPQIRPRTIFIANRFGMANPYPKAQLLPHQYKPIESVIFDLPEYIRIPEINHEWTRHSPEYMERIAKVPPGGSLYEKYLDAFKRQYPGKPSMTVKENHGGTHIHPYLNRVISAREMARLQTFPDTFLFAGSMKKAMWQIGNAVPPRLAECIGYALISCLNDIVQKQTNDAF
ncbi:DNA (cytosine-5-)-methyltransferase [Nostocales cyanobacterium HT-58-2]|nr:DNA (cytosine-5-)-methyltransferase [Nostocales cyanobacterium HT-58-2]